MSSETNNTQDNENHYSDSKKEIGKYLKCARGYTGDASKIARQLAFGEGAIFWIFVNQSDLKLLIITGLSFLVLYFIFDIIQYLTGAWQYKNLGRTLKHINKKEDPINPEIISVPPHLNSPISFCFVAKFLMLTLASFILFIAFAFYATWKPVNGGVTNLYFQSNYCPASIHSNAPSNQ